MINPIRNYQINGVNKITIMTHKTNKISNGVKVSAPGKAYLIGEHSVVYGEPAIIASIDKRTYVSIKPAKNITYLDLAWPDISHTWSQKELFQLTQKTFDLWKSGNEKKNFSQLFDFIKKNGYQGYRGSILGIAMKMLGIREGFSITINSEIPTGAGLGSSASRAVAITKALAELFEKKVSLEKINEIAYEQEKIIHGTPSGGDNSACCFGGLIWFEKAQPRNKIVSLKKDIPYQLENFVFVYTGQPKKTTGELVQQVSELNEEYRTKRIKKIGKMSYQMLEALKRKDFQRMKEIINQTQKNLAELGVSTKEIDKLSQVVQKIGGAAKLCGAGGGGIVLSYHEDKEKLINLLKALGYQPWESDLAVESVRIDFSGAR